MASESTRGACTVSVVPLVAQFRFGKSPLELLTLLLCRYIVEQQYAKAVVIVLKTRQYVNTISQELNLAGNKASSTAGKHTRSTAASQAAEIAAAAAQAQTQALVEVLNRIDELCAHLAVTIRKSVLNLPTSPVRALSDH